LPISKLSISYFSARGLIVLAILSLLVSSCGFHLRGTGQSGSWPVQLQKIQLRYDGPVDRDFRELLQSRLIDRHDVKIVSQGAPELVISGVSRDRRVLSLGATGKVTEYVLRFQASFALYDHDEKILIEKRTIKLQQAFTFDSTLILAKQLEEARLSEQMQNEAVRRILHSVNTSTHNL